MHSEPHKQTKHTNTNAHKHSNVRKVFTLAVTEVHESTVI